MFTKPACFRPDSLPHTPYQPYPSFTNDTSITYSTEPHLDDGNIFYNHLLDVFDPNQLQYSTTTFLNPVASDDPFLTTSRDSDYTRSISDVNDARGASSSPVLYPDHSATFVHQTGPIPNVLPHNHPTTYTDLSAPTFVESLAQPAAEQSRQRSGSPEDPNQTGVAAAARGGRETFVVKLFYVVSDQHTDDFIWWDPDGRKFYFKESDQYARLQLMKSNNIQSFIRQLNSYGFSKHQTSVPAQKTKRNEKIDIEPYCFWHPEFQQGHPEQLQNINRKEGARNVANRLRVEIYPPSPTSSAFPNPPYSDSPVPTPNPTTPTSVFHHQEPFIQGSPVSHSFTVSSETGYQDMSVYQLPPPPSPMTADWVYQALVQERRRAYIAEHMLCQRVTQLEDMYRQLRQLSMNSQTYQ